MNTRARVALALFAFLFATHLAAQDHPNLQSGLVPETDYAHGNMDHINLFNGHLVLRIPLGISYPISQNFSYQFVLVYNSNPWEFQTRTVLANGTTTEFNQALPAESSNAGLGWQLSFGRLDLSGPRPNEIDSFSYIDQEGGVHDFYARLHDGDPEDDGDTPSAQHTLYTRDGSYLRLTVSDGGGWRLESPDGRIHSFDSAGRLTEIADRFTSASGRPANWLRISYGPNTWTISDSQGRTHTVSFIAGGAELGPVISDLTLAAFAGTTATYRFAQTFTVVSRPGAHNDTGPGSLGPTATVPLLTKVELPDGSTFDMPPSDYLTAFSDSGLTDPGPRSVGSLSGLTLPTGGRIEWTYQVYRFPPQSGGAKGLDRVAGVATRTLRDSGAAPATWEYGTSLSEPRVVAGRLVYDDLVNTMTDPLGNRTTSYFSVFTESSSNLPDPAGWRPQDYGLQFTRKANDGAGHFLSSQVSNAAGTLLRSRYVLYESDQIDTAHAFDLELSTNLNRRLRAERTVYHASSPDQENLFAEVTYSRFDGLGTYRRMDTGGNFPSGNLRSTFTNVNVNQRDYEVDAATNAVHGGFTMLASSLPWLLHLTQSVEVTENAKTATTLFMHDPSTGFLASRRQLKAWTSATGCNDTLASYTPDGSGNVARAAYRGGDTQRLCDSALPAPAYEIQYTYQAGVQATAEFLNASGAPVLKTLDQTIDKNTGLVASSRDSANLETVFTYDGRGRLLSTRPASGAWMDLCYASAASARSCQSDSPLGRANTVVTARRNGQAGGAALATTQSVADGFGRTIVQRRLRDGGWDASSKGYDVAGNLAFESVIARDGTTAKATRYSLYDPFGRPGRISAPDGHDLRLFYEGVFSQTRTTTVGTALSGTQVLETPVSHTERFDRQGRLWRVLEPSNPDGTVATTTYSYNPLGLLTSVSMQTVSGVQPRSFDYDGRGFLSSASMPEREPNGVGLGNDIDYPLYDALGHATQVVDGVNDLSFLFDRAARLVQVKETGPSGRVLKAYTYGTGSTLSDRSSGKVKTAKRFNYHSIAGLNHVVEIAQTYTYGAVGGRPSQRVLTMAFNGHVNEAFTQGWQYDDLGNIVSLEYPRCSFTPCTDGAPDSFEDVPVAHPDRAAIEALFAAGVTAGCSLDPLKYCPETPTSRRDAAVMVLRALEGRHYQPPAATGSLFSDVPSSDWGAAFIEEFARRGITAGCGNGAYCPDSTATNGELAVFILRAVHGSGFTPPGCTATGFVDVPCSHRFSAWIQQLAREGRTDGCGGGLFCPDQALDRASMADVLVDGFFLPAAQSPSAPRTITFGYADGFLTSVNGYSNLFYHPNGLVSLVTNSNGLHWTQGNDPDGLRRPGSIGLSGLSTASLGSYSYDGSGDIVGIGADRYLYDTAQRIARWTFSDGTFQTYGYDGFGNRISATSSKLGFGRNTPVFPSTNRLAGAASYDRSGNLTSWNGSTYQYDPLNQMTHFSSGAQEWLFSYDADGERAWAHKPSTGSTTRVDRWTLRGLDNRPLRIYEATDFGWRVEKDYVYREGTLLASEAPSEGRRFFYPDHLGSPRQIANAIGGATSGHHYFAYGEELAPNGRERLKFTGHERDTAEASSTADDLDYMHARFYNPLLGRFTSADPGPTDPRNPAVWNRFTYALGNPVRFVDPDGRAVPPCREDPQVYPDGCYSPLLNNPPTTAFEKTLVAAPGMIYFLAALGEYYPAAALLAAATGTTNAAFGSNGDAFDRFQSGVWSSLGARVTLGTMSNDNVAKEAATQLLQGILQDFLDHKGNGSNVTAPRKAGGTYLLTGPDGAMYFITKQQYDELVAKINASRVPPAQ